MTDFQTAMSLAGAIVVLAALVMIFQPRRPSVPRPIGVFGEPASADELAQVRSAQAATDRRLGEVAHDLAQVRTMMGALPSKDAVHRIELEVAELKGDIKLNNVQTLATSKGVERIENWLMEEAQRQKSKKAEGEKDTAA